ncbi:MAG: hypothetical protein IPJ76_09665 [Flavobacteriales bacterium]|nr:MAG: hypothetical protein IPJ76_09665 [Flavobacteriales bacterium]
MDKRIRANECAAFARMVEVCQKHRAVWSKHEVSNRAIARFYTSVDMLLAAIDNKEEDYYTPRPGSPYHRLPKELVLQRLVDRANAVYDHLEKPSSRVRVDDLPPRSMMPFDEAGLVRFCAAIDAQLGQHRESRATFGSFSNLYRLLHAALKQYAESTAPQQPLIQTARSMGAYRRCLNSCLRALIERVDPCLPRYAEHREFQEEYIAARKNIMAITVDARRTYHVAGYGAASLRHTRANEWTPWNDPLAQLHLPADGTT